MVTNQADRNSGGTASLVDTFATGKPASTTEAHARNFGAIGQTGAKVQDIRRDIAQRFVLDVTGGTPYKAAVKRIGAGYEQAEQVLQAIIGDDTVTEDDRTKAQDALDGLHRVYKTKVSARNSVVNAAAKVADALGVRTELDEAGYADDSQNPVRRDEAADRRKQAAKDAAVKRSGLDPQDALGCLQRATELVTRAKDADPQDGEKDALKALASAVRSFTRTRSKAQTKSA